VLQVSFFSELLHLPFEEMRTEPLGTSPTVFFETQPVMVAAFALLATNARLRAARTERRVSRARCREGWVIFMAVLTFLSFYREERTICLWSSRGRRQSRCHPLRSGMTHANPWE
jgi:hypothetical protein